MTTVQALATRGRKVLKMVWREIDFNQFNMIYSALKEDLRPKKTPTLGLVTNYPITEITYTLPNADLPLLKEIDGKKGGYFISEPYMEEED